MVATILLGGCSNAVWVNERVTKNGEDDTYRQIGGVPFYVKKEVFNQTTSYAKTWLKATLSVEKTLLYNSDGKVESFKLDTQSIEKRLLKSQLPELNSIKKSILEARDLTGKEIKSIVSSFSSLNSLANMSNVPREQIGNTMTSAWIVNEDEKYYLNAPLPWFGTANFTQELNRDGTLGKVTSSPDTKLAEGISSLIPLKEYLTGKHVDALESMTNEAAAAELAPVHSVSQLLATVEIPTLKLKSDLVYKVSLNIVEKGYIYKFTKTHEDAPENIKALPFDTEKQTYTRVELGSHSTTEPKIEEGKQVGLTGTVSFPKDW